MLELQFILEPFGLTMNIEQEGNRIAGHIKFLTCCRLFEKLRVSASAKSRRQVLSRFLQLWEDQYAALGSADTRPASGRASFYPCLRLLIPEVDKTRPAYGLRETALSRLYIKAFGIAPNGPVAQSLSHPVYSGKGKDFADLLFEAVRDRCREDNILSLKDANDLLDHLATADDSEERLEAMTQFLRTATAVEQRWMIRVIVRRRSGCGLGVSGVLHCLHPAAPSLWNVTQDLSLLCQRIAEIDVRAFIEGKKSITAPDITLFVPFRPMLCERTNSPESLCQSVVKLCNLGSVDLDAARILIETKYDGERIQIHKSGSTYRYWSRNCLEWTSSYGGDGDLRQGSLTPRLHEAFRLGVRECILDGEIMAFNTWSHTIVPKTSGFDVKRSEFASGSVGNWFGEDEVDAYQPCVVLFDVMYLNGKSLTTTPLLERRSLLKELFVQHNLKANEGPAEISDIDEFDYLPEPILDGTVYLSRWNLVPVKLEEVSKIFNRLIDARQEGLVAKLTVGASPYLPGRRLHGGWWKLKPDYVEGLLTDLDCLVVGGCYLSVLGRRTKRIGHFICAVRDDRNHTNEVIGAESLPTFLSFCRVSSGLTTNQLKEINAKLHPYWKPYDRKHPNTGPTEWLRVTTERPDVWIAPQHSITFQIHASEINPSLSYAAGLTLRFPRIAAVREDKPWQDCLTVTQLTQLNQETQGKMAVRRLPVPGSDVDSDTESGLDTEASPYSDRRSSEHFPDSAIGLSTSDYSADGLSTFGDKPQASSTPKKQRKLRRNDQYRCPNDVPTAQDQSLIGIGFLSGYELCLILPPDQRKTDLDLRVRNSGGTVVQNPGSDTFCIVADKLTAKIKNLIGCGLSSNTELPVTGSNYNIVRVEWLLRVFDKGEMIQWKPSDMYAMTSAVAKTMFSRFDRFGDSFTEPISSDELRSLCAQSAAKESRIHSPQQWKLTSELLDELKSTDISSFAPLLSYYILALPHVNSLDGPSASSTDFLFNRLMVADLRRLGAVVLYFDCNICTENIPELVQFVASQLGVSNRRSSGYSGPKLSHILLLSPPINADDALCLNSLKDQLLDSCLCHPGGPLVVDKIWAKQYIDTELCYPETAVDI